MPPRMVRLKPDTTDMPVRLKPDTTDMPVRLKPDTTETPAPDTPARWPRGSRSRT